MSKNSLHAVIVAVAVAIGGGVMSHTAVAAQSVSAAVAKPMDAANKAVRAKKWDEAIVHLREVNGISGKSAYDTHVMNQLMGYALVSQGKQAEALPYLEAQAGSAFSSAAEKTNLNKQMLVIHFNLKNYPKAVEMGQSLIASGAADASTFNVMAQAYEKQGKLGDAVKFVKNRVDSAVSGGRKPAENDLLILLDYQARLKDENGRMATFERLVSYYPKAAYWENVLSSLTKATGSSDAVKLNLFRLMASTGTLKKHQDYSELAQLALERGASGEAASVVDAGLAKNAYPEDRKASAGRLSAAAKKQAQDDRAKLPGAEAAASAAKNGEGDIRVGQTYYGFGEYDKAIAAYKRGIAKGGLKSPEEAQILLGIAQLKGKKAGEASATFRAVKAGDPQMVRLAALWALHSK
ncbi:MAG: hypothetical protein RL026_2615 [Pseudomonadota bacterium]|jgi:tetratricopeptide (TPR) repeat protein